VALDDAGVIASARMGVLRFSPHLYNERDDVARALDTLQRARARSG
jgi:selenocysteine lyase/cysteine desulfurase